MTKELEITLAKLLKDNLNVDVIKNRRYVRSKGWEEYEGFKLNVSMPYGVSRTLINKSESKVLMYSLIKGVRVIGIVKTKRKTIGFVCEKSMSMPTKLYPVKMIELIKLISNKHIIEDNIPEEILIKAKAMSVLEQVC